MQMRARCFWTPIPIKRTDVLVRQSVCYDWDR